MKKTYLVSGIVSLVLFFFLAGGKVLYSQRVHFNAAEQYFAQSNWKLAIREYDRTMNFYFPMSPYIQRSAEKLWHIGEMFEKENEMGWANIAYSSIRSSFYASRSLYTPGKDWIRKCDEKIADLNVRLLIKEGSLKEKESEEERKRFLSVMTADRAPDPLWSVFAETGFLGWIASVFFMIFKGFDENGKIRVRFALYGIGSFCFAFSVWIISLLKV